MGYNIKRIAVLLLILLFAALLFPAKNMSVGLRLYEGFQNSNAAPTHVTTSFYVKKSSLKPDVYSQEVITEKKKLLKIFNLQEIDLIGAGNFILQAKKGKNSGRIVIVNQQKLTVILTLLSLSKNQFRAEIIQGEEKTVLKTEVVLPQYKRTVIGFEDIEKRVYFLAFQRGKNQSSRDTLNFPEKLEKPQIIYKILPKYPESARDQGIEGTVILEARTDQTGKIDSVKIVSGRYDLLNEAAAEAVKQWRFKPADPKIGSIPWIFEIYCNFFLKITPAKADRKVNIGFNNKRIQLKKGALPAYPEEAFKLGKEGKVRLGIVVNKNGKVMSVDIIGGDKMFFTSCLKTVKQWEFEPYLKKGLRQYIKFVTEINFTLNK